MNELLIVSDFVPYIYLAILQSEFIRLIQIVTHIYIKLESININKYLIEELSPIYSEQWVFH